MKGSLRLAGMLIVGAGAVAAIASGRDWLVRPEPVRGAWAIVRRADLETTLLAGGDLQPAGVTMISCQVEDTTDEGPVTILSLAENGAMVKKGDVVCRIDRSRVAESIRLQEIMVEQARAEHRQAELTLEVAQVALREQENGLIRKTEQEYRGKAALKRSEVERQADRLAWAEEMLAKGYLSHDDVATERQKKARLAHELRKVEAEADVFRRYTAPKETLTLRGDIETARSKLGLALEKLQSREGRLASFRQSLASCTVVAPRDGIVLRCNKRSIYIPEPLEPGSQVSQGQDLLSMPDDSKTEVDVSVHETMGRRVKVGTLAKVRIWAQPDHVYPGRVAGISMFPVENWKEWDETIRHYVVRVKFDEPPTGVLPLMSADVTFDTGRVEDVLVIPVTAMTMFDGHPSCVVATPTGGERRAIAIGNATRELLEVVSGLDEGDYVLLQ